MVLSACCRIMIGDARTLALAVAAAAAVRRELLCRGALLLIPVPTTPPKFLTVAIPEEHGGHPAVGAFRFRDLRGLSLYVAS
jgi:hypothetical protein